MTCDRLKRKIICVKVLICFASYRQKERKALQPRARKFQTLASCYPDGNKSNKSIEGWAARSLIRAIGADIYRGFHQRHSLSTPWSWILCVDSERLCLSLSLHCLSLQNAAERCKTHLTCIESSVIHTRFLFSCATGSLSLFPKRNVSSLPHLVLATPPLIISFFFWEIKRMCCPSHERRVFSFFWASLSLILEPH